MLIDDIKAALGTKYKPDTNEYCIGRHRRGELDLRDVPLRVQSGWKKVGEIPDATPDENGTMLILERKKDGKSK